MEPSGAETAGGEGGIACLSGSLAVLKLTVGDGGIHGFRVSEGCRSCQFVLGPAHLADVGIHSIFLDSCLKSTSRAVHCRFHIAPFDSFSICG